MYIKYENLDRIVRMKKRLRRAYIRGVIDMLMILYVISSIAYFWVYTVEKYFM